MFVAYTRAQVLQLSILKMRQETVTELMCCISHTLLVLSRHSSYSSRRTCWGFPQWVREYITRWDWNTDIRWISHKTARNSVVKSLLARQPESILVLFLSDCIYEYMYISCIWLRSNISEISVDYISIIGIWAYTWLEYLWVWAQVSQITRSSLNVHRLHFTD